MRGKSEDELARKFMVQFCFEPLRCRRRLEVEGAEVCQQQCGSARVVAPLRSDGRIFCGPSDPRAGQNISLDTRRGPRRRARTERESGV